MIWNSPTTETPRARSFHPVQSATMDTVIPSSWLKRITLTPEVEMHLPNKVTDLGHGIKLHPFHANISSRGNEQLVHISMISVEDMERSMRGLLLQA